MGKKNYIVKFSYRFKKQMTQVEQIIAHGRLLLTKPSSLEISTTPLSWMYKTLKNNKKMHLWRQDEFEKLLIFFPYRIDFILWTSL